MRKLHLLFLGLLMIASARPVFSLDLVTLQDNEKQIIGRSIEYVIDSSRQRTAHDIQEAAFKKGDVDVMNFASNQNPIWSRFRVKNGSSGKIYLEIQNGLIENLEIYQLNKANGRLDLLHSGGISMPFAERSNDSEKFLYALPLQNEESAIFYVKASTLYPFHLPMVVYSDTELINYLITNKVFWGIYIGMMIFAFLYNFFISTSIREKTYYHYLTFIVLSTLFYLSLEGFGFKYLWPNNPSLNFYIPILISANNIFVILFSYSFLGISKNNKWLFRIGAGFVALFGLNIVLNIVVNHGIADLIAQMLSLPMIIYLMTMGVRGAIHGARSAKYYVLAWTAFVASVFVFIFTLNNVIPSNFFTSHSIFFGHMSEVILLSFALADKINVLKKENEAKQQKIINQQAKMNKELEEQVAARTKEIRDKNEQLVKLNEEVTEQNDNIKASITYAKKIQQALLPNRKLYEYQNVKDSFTLFEPKDIVSGDYYWHAHLKELNKTVVVQMDCTGHGVPGAFMSIIGINILNHVVLQNKVTDPSEILNKVSLELYEMLNKNATEQNRDSMEGTICVLDHNTKKLSFAGARGSILIVRKNEEIIYLKGDKNNLGESSEDTVYTIHEHSMGEDLKMYMFSDGYQDQLGGEKNRKFMGRKFRELVVDTSALPFDQQERKLRESLLSWRGDEPQTDDVTVMGLRFLGDN